MPEIEPFDPNQHEPQQPYEPVRPPGWYQCIVTKTEVQRVKDNPNHAFLKVDLSIDESRHPEQKGKVVFDRLNLWNSNETAVRIARGQFSALCHAAGHLQVVTNTDVLVGARVAVKVSVREAKGEYDASNDVKGYDTIANRIGVAGAPQPSTAPVAPSAAPVAPPAPTQQVQPPQQTHVGDVPPWERPKA